MSVHPSVCPHETTRLPLDGFSWNLIFEYFSKNCRENSRFIKIGQEQRVLYVKTTGHFWSHLAQFFLQREIFQTNVAEKIQNTLFMFSNFFSENRALYENVRKYCGTAKAQLTIWRLCLSYWISKATNTHSQYVMFIFFPYDNVCTDVPRCYVILMCIASLFSASYWGSS